MLLTGKILLANNISQIFSGDTINLIIEIENQEKFVVKEIYLNFLGIVNVKWDDLLHKNKDGKIIYFMQLFEDQQTLLNKHVTVQTMDVLDKGRYQYNTLFKLPHQLPESINRKYGSLKYQFVLSANYAAGSKVLCKMPLDIKKYLNICQHKEYMVPFHCIVKKSLCWGICNIQPLKIIVTLPNISFLPGDSIEYFVKIEHFNKILDLQRLAIILTQMHHYKSYKPKERTKQIHTSLNQTTHVFSENHHNSQLKGFIRVPECAVPTSTIPCLINTSYILRFILVFKGFHTDNYVTIPIMVGSHRDDIEKLTDFTKNETILQLQHQDKTEYEV